MPHPPRAYFDHAATAPLDSRVLDEMLPLLTNRWANPSSIYREAQDARAILDAARDRVAAVFRCDPDEVIFTSGGTEADNLALRGVVGPAPSRAHVVVAATEHHAVLHAAEQLERSGVEVTRLGVGPDGLVNPADLDAAVRPETVLVSIAYANNEIGAVQPIRELASTTHRANPAARFHTDAVQAAGFLDLDVRRLGVDLLSVSAHKLGGPKGVGALYLRRGTPLAPQNVGGGQERNRRAGTEDVAGAVGLACALELAVEERDARVRHARAVAVALIPTLRSIDGCRLTGPSDPAQRLPGLVSAVVEGVAAEDLLIRLDLLGFAASSGAACTTGSLEPSHVLRALGLDDRLARGSLRLSAGPETPLEAAHRLANILPDEIVRLRRLAEATA